MALVLGLGLGACSRDWTLPPRPGTTSGCQADTDCVWGLCTDSGACDEYACETDAQCRKGLCDNGECNENLCAADDDCVKGLCRSGMCNENGCDTNAECSPGLCVAGLCDATACNVDGDCGAGLCRSGTCDTSACNVDMDCSEGLCVAGTCDANACASDAECTWGLCDAGACDATACNVDDDCEWGLCDGNKCNTAWCKTGDDCQSVPYCRQGLCSPEECYIDADCDTANGESCFNNKCKTGGCTADTDCTSGACVNGACDILKCRQDSHCWTGAVCNNGGTGALGSCVTSGTEGPALVGDPTALKMTDNLAAAYAFVRIRHPTADLVQINGSYLAADGTVDITQTYGPWWLYGFVEGDGTTQPKTWATVMYTFQAGTAAGLYDGDAGNIVSENIIAQSTWQNFLDPTVLMPTFMGEPDCTAMVADSSDSALYNDPGTGPRVILSNWQSESWIGDPVAGTGTASCTP